MAVIYIYIGINDKYIHHLWNLMKDTVTTVSPETNFDCTIAKDSDADIVIVAAHTNI